MVAQLDGNWKPIPGTEGGTFEVDVIALAVGLRPSIELLQQAGCGGVRYVRELGGHVAVRDGWMETTVRGGIFVAGDSAGIEEATTAMLEGKIAGIAAALRLGIAGGEEWLKEIEGGAQKALDEFRSGGPFGRHVLEGIKKAMVVGG